MTVFIDNEVSKIAEEKVRSLVENEMLYNPAFSCANIEIERGDGMYIDSASGNYDYDNMQLLSKIQHIIEETQREVNAVDRGEVVLVALEIDAYGDAAGT